MLRRRLLVTAGGAVVAASPYAYSHGSEDDFEVDLALVLAVDVSASVNSRRFQLQQRGYVEAFRNDEVIKRITSGHKGITAVALVQWSGAYQQVRVAGWKKITNKKSAEEFAQEIEQMQRQYFGSTSIGSALVYCTEQFRWAPTANQLVIDMSGDGRQEEQAGFIYGSVASQLSVRQGRNYAIARGVVINGLPVMWQYPADGSRGEVELNNANTMYEYTKNVIGGPGAFYVVLDDPDDGEKVIHAVRRKLLREAGV